MLTTDDLKCLPAPVRAYYENTLQMGQPYINSVHLNQDANCATAMGHCRGNRSQRDSTSRSIRRGFPEGFDLAEVVWYPAALFPSGGVQWEGVEAQTAKAMIRQSDVSGSLDGVSFRISRLLDPSRRYQCNQKYHCRADDEPGPRHQTRRARNRQTDARSEPQHWIVAEREP